MIEYGQLLRSSSFHVLLSYKNQFIFDHYWNLEIDSSNKNSVLKTFYSLRPLNWRKQYLRNEGVPPAFPLDLDLLEEQQCQVSE
ncbi:MAG: hypothetical protein ACTSP4_15765 [Candidatus Hodarchaeales archaeon]